MYRIHHLFTLSYHRTPHAVPSHPRIGCLVHFSYCTPIDPLYNVLGFGRATFNYERSLQTAALLFYLPRLCCTSDVFLIACALLPNYGGVCTILWLPLLYISGFPIDWSVLNVLIIPNQPADSRLYSGLSFSLLLVICSLPRHHRTSLFIFTDRKTIFITRLICYYVSTAFNRLFFIFAPSQSNNFSSTPLFHNSTIKQISTHQWLSSQLQIHLLWSSVGCSGYFRFVLLSSYVRVCRACGLLIEFTGT